jgi:predicted nucleotidyltransferase
MNVHIIIDEIVERIRHIEGVSVIVLGGSRARGTHTPESDVDLGIYYDPNHPLDLQALNLLATDLDDEHRSQLLTPIGGWGPWINGGGWLKVRSVAVDFLYRDLNQVRAVIKACTLGEFEIVYQPGHPHGFVSSIYMGEIAICQPLWEADGEISALKTQASVYPAALKQAIVEKFAWEILFSLENAKKSERREDISYVAGCCFRSVSCMLQVLFALNEQYLLNEKGAIAMVETFARRPAQFKARVEKAFQLLCAEKNQMVSALNLLNELADEIVLPRSAHATEL